MDDLISRKQAIRIASGYCHWANIPDELAKLPSVNPQANNEDIHREREQAYMRGYEDGSRKYRTEPCGDAISRVAAIDKLDEWDWQEFYLPIHFKELLDELPSVSTEKAGRWHRKYDSIVNDYFWECDNCKCGFQQDYPYCPNCGAKMEKESETCKDCMNKCIMYEPNMKGCKDKKEGVEE